VVNGQALWITKDLSRRSALVRLAAGGVAIAAHRPVVAAAQEGTAVAPGDARAAYQIALVAGDLRSALAPVVVAVRTQSDDELNQEASSRLSELKDQQNITEEEAGALQQIVDAAGQEDTTTAAEKIQEIADQLTAEEETASPAAVAIAAVARALIRRDGDDSATPEAGSDDSDFWDSVKRGIVGAIAGAAVGGLIAGEDGAVIGAIAGGLIGIF
jgi:hypothetical protein